MNKHYIAGLFDGEGCVRIYKNKDKFSQFGYRYGLVAMICLTNKSPLIEAQKKWKGKIYLEKRYKKGWSDIWRWKVHCDEAKKFLRDIFELVYVKKREVKIALDFQNNCMSRITEKGGFKKLNSEEFKQRDKYYIAISKAKNSNRGGKLRNENLRRNRTSRATPE